MQALVEGSLDMITVLSLDLTIEFQSRAVVRMLGVQPRELEGTKLALLVHPHDLQRLRAACAEAADGIAPRPVEVQLRRHDGGWLQAEALVRHDAQEGVLVVHSRDISERSRLERRSRLNASRQAVIADLGARALAGLEIPVLVREVAERLRDALEADHVVVLRCLQRTPDELVVIAQAGEERYGDRPAPTAVVAHAAQSGEPVIVRDWEREERFAERESFLAAGVASTIAVPIPGAAGPYGAIVAKAVSAARFGYDEGVLLQAIANVIAGAYARIEGEERIRHQALHDPLTGLPNRTLFEDRVTRALASGARHGRRLAVMFLDLDSFKLVREGLGHSSSDALLETFAERIGKCLRDEDTLARVGGDEFAVLLPEVLGQDDVLRVVRRIKSALAKPLVVGEHQIVTSASIGIALGQGGVGNEAGALMRDADLAMYAAKEQGPGGCEFFAEYMRDTAVRQLELTSDLYQAIERDEFEVHFQPVIHLADDSIVGAEALVRWRHPHHGLLMPGMFLPIAEETGLIVPIGRLVLRAACRTLRGWQLAGAAGPEVRVGVNLGPQQLSHPTLIEDVSAALRETGLAGENLVLEITEDVLLSRDGVSERLLELKELGVMLAVDDFGTGYSALSHLQRLPIDLLKIDKGFLDALEESADHACLIQGVIELAHALGMLTVAEGIETEAQAAAVRALGSDGGQGYHFARPLPAVDVQALLASRGADPSDLELTR
jgi:diguanylate cyclase (GGDEF)-like protein/PAS domain S-box-containing protein